MNNTNIHKVGVCRKSSVVLSLLLGSATLVLSTLTSSAGATQFTVPFDSIVDVPGLVAAGYGECPEINYPLHLTGDSHLVIKDNVIKGVHQLTIQNGVNGIATDALGNTFVFSYQNHLRGNFEVSLGEETAVVFITDKFTMEGEAGHFSLGFVGTLVFDEFGNFLRLEVDHSHGNYVCDPI
jgi:hypothetical protein